MSSIQEAVPGEAGKRCARGRRDRENEVEEKKKREEGSGSESEGFFLEAARYFF